MEPGDFVTYIPNNENGIVKSISPEGNIFVVYKCGGDWKHYYNYSAALTRKKDLKLGWYCPDEKLSRP